MRFAESVVDLVGGTSLVRLSKVTQSEVTPTEVTVTGPESDVARVTAVLGTVRFGDAQIDIESPDIPAIPVDAAGVPVDGLQVEPGVITVKVPVLPIATTRQRGLCR